MIVWVNNNALTVELKLLLGTFSLKVRNYPQWIWVNSF